MNCALCNADDFEIVSRSDAKTSAKLLVSLCRHCGLVQQTPLPSLDELHQYYAHHYRNEYKNTATPKPKHIYRAGVTALQRLAFLQAHGVTAGKLLDIGAGGGEFVYLAAKAGFQAHGIEPNLGYSEYAQRQYGCHVMTGELQTIREQYDILTMFHVLEHLPSPLAAFQTLYGALHDRGKLLIEVPWIEANNASPHNIYFKAHIFYFSVDTLIACASAFFDVLAVDTSSNLKILFQAKTTPDTIVLPSAHSVARLRKTLQRKGWIEYLFAGKGYRKPITKLRNWLTETRLANRPPRTILDELFAKMTR